MARKIAVLSCLIFSAVILTTQLSIPGENSLSYSWNVLTANIGSSMGMTVGVAENPDNRVAMALRAKEQALLLKEDSLAIKEADLENALIQRQAIITVSSILLAISLVGNILLLRRRRDQLQTA